jgi:hypothetical protein
MTRRSRWSKLVAVLALTAVFLAGGCEPADPGPDPVAEDEGAFLIRLGTDTVGAERYRLTPERMEVLAVSRSPRTLHREVTLEFDAEGGIVRYESQVRDPAEPEAEATQRTVIAYGPDHLRVEEGPGQGDETEGGPDVVPFSLNHFSLSELAIRRALDEGRDEFRMWLGGLMEMELHRPRPDSVAMVTPTLGTWRAMIDEEGRIVRMEAGALGRDVERVPDLDVDALARSWAEADARGEGMGPLSPRDTTTASVAGAEILVDYSRPSARGRQVFGGLVPLGEIWRTGADAATTFSTDRALVLGGETLPPGRYSIFTIPDEESWTLIVNEQAGQPGTEHDPDLDLFRIPLAVRTLEEPVERFTIAVEPEGDGGVLRFLWAEVEARVGFDVGE